MKIWIINHYATPPSMGGLVRHYYFSKYLQEKGHQVRIFTASKIHNTEFNMIKNKRLYREKSVDGIQYTFVKTSDYSGNGIDRIVNMLQFPLRIWSVCKSFEKPDIIYTSSPDLFTAFSAVLLAKWLNVKKVVEIRDLWPESIVEYNGISRNSLLILILYQMEKWLYQQADQLIFTMAGGKKYIRDKGWEGKINLGKIFHINNGVDLEEYEYNKEHYQIKDEDLLNSSFYKVVYVGSIRKANDVKKLVSAMRYLSEVKLLIYGEGSDRDELEKYCLDKKIKNVVFKGKIDKKYVPYILSQCDLNILNYQQANTWKYGGSQNKLFEYLASGKPICANIEMGYSLVRKYHCGYEGEIKNEKKYAQIIKKFSTLTKNQLDGIKQNESKIIKLFDYKELTKKLIDIID